jgi:centromere protein J
LFHCQKEVEELKIFELLEQHAANSSFCSTSSLVARLMEGSINSTPVKNQPLMAMHNYPTENLATSILHSFSPTGHRNQEQLLSGSLQYYNKNTISGYLPYGLDKADIKSSTIKSLGSDDHRFGVRDKSRNPASEPTITGSNHRESGGEQTSLKTSNKNTGTNGANSPCSKHLHVRFAETNEYKSISDGDTSLSSYGDTSGNSSYSHNHDGHQLKSINSARSTDSKFFQDDQAWSDDDCSCTSSEDGKSLSSMYQSLTVRQSPKISNQNHTVNHEYQAHSTKSYTDRCQTESDKSSYSLVNTCANTDTRADDQNQTDTGRTTQSKSDSEIVFKSSLLRTRLEQLEKEIEIFRQENTTLQKKQKRHADEVLKFNKEKNEFKKMMQEEKEKMESFLQEERKKLNKEKSVFEKYCKDLRNQPTKQEREEIQALKQQV